MRRPEIAMGRTVRRLPSVGVASVCRMNTADVLWAFGSRIHDRGWDGPAALLHEDQSVRLLHTGAEFDKAGYVRLNREHPVEVDRRGR